MNNNRKEEEVVVKKQLAFASVYGIIHFLAFLFAIYLVFKCNNGISFLQLLAAICCPWIYIIYILVTRHGICSDYVKGSPPLTVSV